MVFGHRVSHRTTGTALGIALGLLAGVAALALAQTTALVLQSVSAGSNHACGITAQHVAYCWGRNAEGQLGAASTSTCPETGESCSQKPLRVEGGLPFSAISAGNNFTCGVTTNGAAYCWGAGSYGQLGTGSQASSRRPARAGIQGVTFQSISTGNNHACAVTTSGAAYCWGSNAGGKLGTSASLAGGRAAPAPVTGRVTFRTISAGYFHTCGVTRVGRTYCWGRNEQGELGDSATKATATPTLIAAKFAGQLVHTASQFDFSCAIRQDGVLYCWGANCYGQLGIDSTTEQCGTPAMPCSTRPKPVPGISGWKAVSAMFNHSCAISASGGMMCWGENNQGQLGTGEDGGRSEKPAAVSGTTTYKAVTAGRQFTCALTADGAPQCWGRNAEGQLGTGDTNNRNTPTAVIAP